MCQDPASALGVLHVAVALDCAQERGEDEDDALNAVTLDVCVGADHVESQIEEGVVAPESRSNVKANLQTNKDIFGTMSHKSD